MTAHNKIVLIIVPCENDVVEMKSQLITLVNCFKKNFMFLALLKKYFLASINMG